MRNINMQPNEGEDSKDSDVFILEERTQVRSSLSSVKLDGLASNRAKILEEIAKNGKFIGKPKLKRKKNINDQEYKNGNKFPKTANRSGRELKNVPEEGLKENIASTHPAMPAYMCYECGEEFETENLLKGHLLDHSFNSKDKTDLENRTIKSQLMSSTTLCQDLHSTSSRSSNHSLDSLAINRGNQITNPKHSDSMKFSSNSKSSSLDKSVNKTSDQKHKKLLKISNPSNLLKKSRDLPGSLMRKKGKPKIDPEPSKSLKVSDNSVDLIVIDSGNQTLDPKKANQRKSSVNSGGPSMSKSGNLNSEPKLSNSLSISNNSSNLMKIDNGNQISDPKQANPMEISCRSFGSINISFGKKTLGPNHSKSLKRSGLFAGSQLIKNKKSKLNSNHSILMKNSKCFTSLMTDNGNQTLDHEKANQMEGLVHSEGSLVMKSGKVMKTGKQKLDPKSSKSLKVSDNSSDLMVNHNGNQSLDTNKTNQRKSSVHSEDTLVMKNQNQTLDPKHSNSLKSSNQTSDPTHSKSLKRSSHSAGSLPKHSNSLKSSNQTLDPTHSKSLKRSSHSAGSLPKHSNSLKSSNQTLDPTHSKSLKRSSHSAGSLVMKNGKQKLDPKSSKSLNVSDDSVDLIVIDSGNQTIDPKKANQRKSSVNSGGPSMSKSGNLNSVPKLSDSSSISNSSPDLMKIDNGNQISDPKQANPMEISTGSLDSISISCGNQTLGPNHSNSLKRSGLFAGSLLIENRKPKLHPKHSNLMKNSKSFTSLVTDRENQTLDPEKANEMKSSCYSKGKSVIENQNQTVDPNHSTSLKSSNHSCYSSVIRTEKQTSDLNHKDPLKSSSQSLGSSVIEIRNQTLDPKYSKSLSVNSFLNLLKTDTGNQIFNPMQSNSLKNSNPPLGSSMIKSRNLTLDLKKRNVICEDSEVSHDEIEVLIPEIIPDVSLTLPKPVSVLSNSTGKPAITKFQKIIGYSCQICKKLFETHNSFAEHFEKTHKKQKDTTVSSVCRSNEGSSKDAEATAESKVDFGQVDESFIPKQASTENTTSLLAELSKEVTIKESIKDQKLKYTGDVPFGNSVEYNGIAEPQLFHDKTVNSKGKYFPQDDCAVREEGNKSMPEKIDQGPSKLLTARINTSKCKQANIKAKIPLKIPKALSKIPLVEIVENADSDKDLSNIAPKTPKALSKIPLVKIVENVDSDKDLSCIAMKTPKALSKIPLVEIVENADSDKDLSKPFESSSNSVRSLAVENGSQPVYPKGVPNSSHKSNLVDENIAFAGLENSSKNVEALVANGIIGSGVSIQRVIPVKELESNDKSSENSYNFECKKDMTKKQRKNSISKQTVKPYLCKICGKRFRLQGYFVQHLRKKHGELCNSYGTEEIKNFTECSGNLANSLVDSRQACVTIEKKEAAGNKIPVDNLNSLISDFIRGTEHNVTDNMHFGGSIGCISTEDKAAEKLLSGNNNMECSSIILPSYSNNNSRPVNLPNSLIDFGQVDASIQRKDAAQDKISVDLLGSNIPNCSSVVEKEAHGKVVFGTSMDYNSVSLPNNNTKSNNLTNSSSSSKIFDTVTNSIFPVQPNTIESPYSCPICFKKLSKDYVKIHIRLHQGKPYPCDLCEKSYVTRSRLNRHISMCHRDNEKSLCESSVENIQKTGEAVENPTSKSEDSKVEVPVDTSDAFCQNKLNANENEKNNDLFDSATLEKPNKELGNTAVVYPEGTSLEPSKRKSHSQSKSFIRKSDPLNNISCNVPVESRNVQDKNPLDLDVVVIDKITKENEQNIENVRKEKEKDSGNLSKFSIVHIVTLD